MTKSKAVALSLPLAPSQDGLRQYLQEISRFPMLEKHEEYELSKKWREHGDIAAAHRLVTSHLRLVAKIAFRYRGYGLPVGELHQPIKDVLGGQPYRELSVAATSRRGKPLRCRVSVSPLTGLDRAVTGVILLMEEEAGAG